MVASRRPLVKICGITNLQDALSAVDAGCDALGFIFYRKSPRYITPIQAARIISSLPAKILKIGVFVDAAFGFVTKTAKNCGLDAVQLHGQETPEYCVALKGIKLIKAFRVKLAPDPELLKRYKVWAFLFDTYAPRVKGGTGRAFDWTMLSGVRTRRKMIISGGLNSGNVALVVRTLSPDWVDACSCLELSPGKKDARKMVDFVSRVKKCRV
ncbi:MAG: phosphoribosylanthranilate isomerase [Candidatus Omnitrophota bacterium]